MSESTFFTIIQGFIWETNEKIRWSIVVLYLRDTF